MKKIYAICLSSMLIIEIRIKIDCYRLEHVKVILEMTNITLCNKNLEYSSLMLYKKIKTKSKSDKVVEQIIQSVLDGEYKPGDQVPIENDLAEIFGVSRITIREAFQKLSVMGVVDIREGKGTYIAQPSIKNYMEPLLPILLLSEKEKSSLYEARLFIEVGLASFSAKYATEEDIKKLTEIHQTMVRNFSKLNQPSPVYTFSDQKFHEALAESSHNEFLISIYRTVQDIYRSYIAQISGLISGREASLVEHEAILNAILRKNPDEAEEAMRKHILMAQKLYEQLGEEKEI